MRLEPADDVRGGLALRPDAHLQRLQATEEQPGGVGGGHDPRTAAELVQPRCMLGALRDDRAELDVVVAAEVLRRRVEDEVAAALERPQVDGRRRRGVAENQAGVRGGRLEVRHRQQRVRRSLEPDEVGACGRRPGLVEENVLQPPALELGQQHAGPVVGVLRERDRGAGLEQREHDRRRRAHPRREEERLAAVEPAEHPLGLDADGMRVPRVVERPGLPVDVRPDRRAVERRLHAANLPRTRALGSRDGRDARHHRRQAGLAAGALRAGRAPPAARRRSRGSGSAGSCSPASGSRSCSTPAPSSSSTGTSATAIPTSTRWRTGRTATRS